MDKKDEKNLRIRYLTWLYKITKEAFDRYERKFTQIDIDGFVLRKWKKSSKALICPRRKIFRKIS